MKNGLAKTDPLCHCEEAFCADEAISRSVYLRTGSLRRQRTARRNDGRGPRMDSHQAACDRVPGVSLSTAQGNKGSQMKMVFVWEMETGCAPLVPVGTDANSPAIHRWEARYRRFSTESRRDGRTRDGPRRDNRFRPSLQDLKRGERLLPAMNRWAIAVCPYGTCCA